MKCLKLKQNQIKELRNIINDNGSSSREVKRAQAVIMIDKEKDIEDISEITSYRRRQIYDLRKLYLEKGIIAIKDKRKKKLKELLTQNQRQEITKILKAKKPRDYDYDENYWTTVLLGEFIKNEYNVEYKSRTSLYLLFKEAKFTYHKPGRVYEKRDEQEVLTWRKKTKLKVKKAMKEKDTIILCEDEMILSTQTTFQKIWLPQGEYPKIEISNTKKNRSVYGFLNIKTGTERAFKKERQNMYITTDILKELRKTYQTEKLLILWDGPGWHRGSKVQEFIKKDKNIKTIYFPKYSPEENPQEHVWREGRNKITHNRFIKDIDKATDDFVNYLNKTKFSYNLLGFSADLE